MKKISAPFSEEQCRRLNEWQQSGQFHPFTCGNPDCRAVLIADPSGWRCPDCDYRQNWAHGFMAGETPGD